MKFLLVIFFSLNLFAMDCYVVGTSKPGDFDQTHAYMPDIFTDDVLNYLVVVKPSGEVDISNLSFNDEVPSGYQDAKVTFFSAESPDKLTILTGVLAKTGVKFSEALDVYTIVVGDFATELVLLDYKLGLSGFCGP